MKTLDEIAALLENQAGRPPIERWQPELSGDIDIVIRADGRWFHEGGEIKRHELVKLFASILRREDDGEYYLVTPVEKWRIQVEEHPLQIVDLEQGQDQGKGQTQEGWVMKTNTDTWVPVDAEHPLTVEVDPRSGEPNPSLGLDHGLSAKLARAVFYRLVEAADAEGDELYIRSGGRRFFLGSVEA